jgi:glycerol-3-phosphate acyltransferase PlsY
MFSVYSITPYLIAYLIGSIPTAVWLGQLVYGTDVRNFGSGNAGATNTFRTLGPRAGVPVLLLDILKGFFAVRIAFLISYSFPGSADFISMQLWLGIAAVAGHIFPVFAGFRGGKGIATLLGVMLGIEPEGALISIGVFVAVLITSRIVSLSSILASFSFPLIVIFILPNPPIPLVSFSFIVFAIVLITHQKNIERIIRRNESKATIKLKKARKKPDDENNQQ